MARIIIHVQSFEKNFCQLSNIHNRITTFLRGKFLLAPICEYKNRRMYQVDEILPDDIVIDTKTKWKEIEKLIK